MLKANFEKKLCQLSLSVSQECVFKLYWHTRWDFQQLQGKLLMDDGKKFLHFVFSLSWLGHFVFLRELGQAEFIKRRRRNWPRHQLPFHKKGKHFYLSSFLLWLLACLPVFFFSSLYLKATRRYSSSLSQHILSLLLLCSVDRFGILVKEDRQRKRESL